MAREAVVGFVFLSAVALFAVFVLYSGGLEQVGETFQPLETTFPNVAGLEVDDPVSLAGVNVGTVEQITVEGDQVLVTMQVQTDQPIKTDSTARLQTESLLGGRMIDISLGSASAPQVQAGGRIQGQVSMDMSELVDNVGKMTEDVRSLAQSFESNQDELFTSLGETVDEAKSAFATINRIIGDNEEGLSEAMSSFADIGTRLDGTLARLDDITKQIQSGDGTLGKLVYDSALYDEMLALGQSLNVTAGNLETMFAGEEGEEGANIAEAISSLGDIGPQLRETVARIDRITEKIESGEGTLGKLVNDDELYVEATRAVKAVGDAAENAREQGPITTFTGALVGAATALN